MKKYIFFLVATIVTGIAAHAQPGIKNAGAHRAIIARLLQGQHEMRSSERTTSGVAEERVIAQSTRDTVTGPLSDSIQLSYLAGMGSNYDYNTMIYPYNYTYNSTPMFNFRGVFTKPQVLADTYTHWTLNPLSLVYGLYEQTFAIYDASMNMTSYRHNYTDSVSNQNTSYVNTFNSSGDITQGNWFVSAAGVMDSAYRQYFSYDGSGRLIADSLYEMHLSAWHKVARSFYTYDVSGNLIQIDGFAQTDTTYDSVLVEQVKYMNTYDASNRLTSVATFEFDNTSLAASGLDTFSYTGTSAFHTSWREYQYDNINHYWAPQFRMDKTLNSLALPDTILTNGFDSVLDAWVPQMMQIARYDTAKNPDTLYEFDYNFTSYPALPNYTTVYYYQLYSNTTQVPNVANATLRIWPNPATDAIMIDGTGGNVLATIVDETGRMMLRQQSNSGVKIDVSQLSSGTYYVVVTEAAGRILSRSKFVKL